MDTTILAKKILQITRHGYYEEQVEKIAQLLNSITSASNGAKPIVSGALPLNGTKATELAQIGSRYVYEDALGYGRISEAGIFEVIKKYEEFKRQ